MKGAMATSAFAASYLESLGLRYNPDLTRTPADTAATRPIAELNQIYRIGTDLLVVIRTDSAAGEGDFGGLPKPFTTYGGRVHRAGPANDLGFLLTAQAPSPPRLEAWALATARRPTTSNGCRTDVERIWRSAEIRMFARRGRRDAFLSSRCRYPKRSVGKNQPDQYVCALLYMKHMAVTCNC
jgi:hypothetical protein